MKLKKVQFRLSATKEHKNTSRYSVYVCVTTGNFQDDNSAILSTTGIPPRKSFFGMGSTFISLAIFTEFQRLFEFPALMSLRNLVLFWLNYKFLITTKPNRLYNNIDSSQPAKINLLQIYSSLWKNWGNNKKEQVFILKSL